jgi:hypothetical protein
MAFSTSPAAQAVLDAEVAAIGRAPWSDLAAGEGQQIWAERPTDAGDVYGVEITSMWDDHRAQDCLRLIVAVFQKIGPGDAPDAWSRGLGTISVLRTEAGVVGVGSVRDLATEELTLPRLDLSALLRWFKRR